MTSNRLYAVAALVLSASLPLGACSQAGSREGEAKPKASTPAYPQPAFKVTHAQAKAIASVGQRFNDNTPSAPLRSDAVAFGLCDDWFSANAGRTWHSETETLAPAEGTPPGLAGNDKTQIGYTFSSVTLLDDSPSAAKVGDDRVRAWSTCQPTDEPPFTSQKGTVTGANSSLVRTQVDKDAWDWRVHRAEGLARVENLLLSCTTDARTAKLALSTTTSCLTEMVLAVPFAAEQDVKVNDTNRVVATKMFLVRAASKGHTASLRTAGIASTPCETSKTTFMPAGTPDALIETEVPLVVDDPDTAKTPEILGSVSAVRATDPTAAKAKVAAARKTFGGCRGKYSKGTKPYVATGRIAGVSDEALGEGGFTITRTSQFPGQKKPETIRTSIFSVGPYVVQLYGADPKNAQAIAAQLKGAAGA